MKTTDSNQKNADQPPPAPSGSEGLMAAAKNKLRLLGSRFGKPWHLVRAIAVRKTRRTLLIESDALTNLILRNKLQQAGFEVDTAATGSEVLQRLSDADLDAVLMDLTIGGIRGTELITKIRENPKFSRRPIFVFTCQGLSGMVAVGAVIPGATRLFNKLSTSAGEVVAALAGEFGLARAQGEPGAAGPADPTEAEAANEISRLLKEHVSRVSSDLQALVQKTSTGAEGQAKWKTLRINVRLLASGGAVAGRRNAARLVVALDAFLETLCDEPERVTEAEWRTASSAVEVIQSLCERPSLRPEPPSAEFTAVVVVEGAADLRAKVSETLLNAGLKPIAFPDAAQVLAYLVSHPAELVVLDVALPDWNGIAKKIHDLPGHTKTVVLLVASRGDANGSANAIALNATAELVLKALTAVQKNRLSNPQPAPAVPAPAAPAQKAQAQPEAPKGAGAPKPAAAALSVSAQAPKPTQAAPAQAGEQKRQETKVQTAVPPPAAAASAPLKTQPAASKPAELPQKPEPVQKPQPAQKVEPLQKTEPQQKSGPPPRLEGAPGQAQGQAASPQPAVPKVASSDFAKEREALLARILENETELHKLRARLNRQGETRRRLEEELANATADKAELEKRLETELSKATAEKTELEKRLAEQTQNKEELLDSSGELQSMVEAASATADRANLALQQEAERSKRLEQELADLRQKTAAEAERRAQAETQPASPDPLGARSRVATEPAPVAEATVSSQAESADEFAGPVEAAELQGRLRAAVGSLAHVTAELETERGERQRTEQRAGRLATQLQALHAQLSQHLDSDRTNQTRIAGLEQELLESKKSLVQATGELQQQTSSCQLAEEQLRMIGDSRAQLEKALSLFEDAKQGFQRTQRELEARLEASLQARSESESRLQQETSERRRLAETLEAVELKLHEQAQEHALETSKLESKAQLESFERNRLEGEVARFQHIALDAARAATAQLNKLRRQLRQQVEELYETACLLLQADLPSEHKNLAEALLEDVVSLQTMLQETGPSNGPLAAAGLFAGDDAADRQSDGARLATASA